MEKSETLQAVEELRRWLKTEAKFYGRKDEDFLLMFLGGCKFDMCKTKKKMTMYYQNRKSMPHWWGNRDVNELTSVIEKTIFTVIREADPLLPTLIIVRLSKFGSNSGIFNGLLKLASITVDLVLRRPNCKKHGSIWIFDCLDYPLWFLSKCLIPTMVYNMLYYYTMSTPIKLNAVHVINFPFVARAIWSATKPLLPQKIKERFYFYGSDWCSMKDRIDQSLVPEEYGGENGCLNEHQEAFQREIHNFSAYILDDNKYGFV